jgi:hypothetical protein
LVPNRCDRKMVGWPQTRAGGVDRQQVALREPYGGSAACPRKDGQLMKNIW